MGFGRASVLYLDWFFEIIELEHIEVAQVHDALDVLDPFYDNRDILFPLSYEFKNIILRKTIFMSYEAKLEG